MGIGYEDYAELAAKRQTRRKGEAPVSEPKPAPEAKKNKFRFLISMFVPEVGDCSFTVLMPTDDSKLAKEFGAKKSGYKHYSQLEARLISPQDPQKN
jgi:hypothetical protein